MRLLMAPICRKTKITNEHLDYGICMKCVKRLGLSDRYIRNLHQNASPCKYQSVRSSVLRTYCNPFLSSLYSPRVAQSLLRVEKCHPRLFCRLNATTNDFLCTGHQSKSTLISFW